MNEAIRGSVFNMFSPYGLASLNWTLLGDEFGVDTGAV